MNNVLDTSAERQPLTLDKAEDAILARWEDPEEEQVSDDATEAALDTTEETGGDLEFDEEETEEVDDE